jgi:hypothetical protein
MKIRYFIYKKKINKKVSTLKKIFKKIFNFLKLSILNYL